MAKTKGTIAFRAIYISLTALLAIAIAVGLFILYSFLSDYEKTLPEKSVDEIITRLNSGDYSDITATAEFQSNGFEDENVYNEYCNGLFNGDYTYSRISKESSEVLQTYKIKSGKNEIARVVLKQTGGKSSFGFPLYSISSVTSGEVKTKTVTVTAPSCASVYLNGICVDTAYITSKSEPDKSLDNFLEYLDMKPYNVTYTVDGFLNEPVITAKDFMGNELQLGENNTFSLATTKDDELSQYALDFSLTYSKFISNDGTKAAVIEQLTDNNPMIPDIEDFENNYYAWHTDYAFADEKASEPTFYSENCATVRVTYNHIIESTETFTFPADNTIYLVKINGEWRVSQLIMN